jgi:hypothetical protein
MGNRVGVGGWQLALVVVASAEESAVGGDGDLMAGGDSEVAPMVCMREFRAKRVHFGRTLRFSQHASILRKVKVKRKTLLRLSALAMLVSVYPLCVLFYTWGSVFRSDLEGGRHGPLDAYRHTLASAVVSYTLGQWAVNFTTGLMESRGKDSNNMDSHNNRIGAGIGVSSKSFHDLEPSVRQSVLNGAVNSTNTNQVTWLPKEKWKSGRIW